MGNFKISAALLFFFFLIAVRLRPMRASPPEEEAFGSPPSHGREAAVGDSAEAASSPQCKSFAVSPEFG